MDHGQSLGGEGVESFLGDNHCTAMPGLCRDYLSEARYALWR